MTGAGGGDTGTRDDELLADLFDQMLQDILEGRATDLAAHHAERPHLRDRIAKTWHLACSVAGRRAPSRPVLGGYEILRELGHGGMGTVYLARHQSLQRDVAIKVLPHSLAMSPRAKQRFLEEARAMARIRHEHVVHIHRIIDHAEMLAFEMEFIDGPSLQSLILALREKPKPFAPSSLAEVLGRDLGPGIRSSVDWFVHLTIKMARALGEVHRHGLVHRDVKPSNIVLWRVQTQKLADFGLAMQGDLDATSSKFAGTPVYAAPERLRGDEGAIDARTDVYSLGVTLYEALTSGPPFAGSSTNEVLRRIESGNAPGLRQRAPHVSRDLAIVVGKAMEPDPRHRYATADEFADDLERLLSLQPILARPAGALRRSWKFLRRHQRVVVAAAFSAVLATALIWPLAAKAHAASEAAQVAAAARHRARCAWLRPECLPSAWTSGPTEGRPLRSADAIAARQRAFAAALQHYDDALRATPDDGPLHVERNVVAAVAALDRGNSVPTDQRPELPATCRTFLGHQRAHRRLGHKVADLAAASDLDDRFGAGLLAFLGGDYGASTVCWSTLPSPLRDDPLLDACLSLQAAHQAAPARAYPRLFHAAKAFPNATALVHALADAALAEGDLSTAEHWLATLPVTQADTSAYLRELLTADVAAAAGRNPEAARGYRRLVAADATSPIPLLRLGELALRSGDRKGGERVFRHILQRWPELAQARLQLARLALQSRDLGEYLAHARHAFGEVHRPASPDAADLAGILHLGGLHRLATELGAVATVIASRGDDSIPLAAWLRGGHVAGIEQAIRLLAMLDATTNAASSVDPRTVGIWLRSVWLLLQHLPQATLRLPWTCQVGALAALPALFGAPTDWLAALLLPYQSSLGTPLHRIPDRQIYQRPTASSDAFYGAALVVGGDLDGDTLPELCIGATPQPDGEDPGSIEFRGIADGALLRTWASSDEDSMFARALAIPGDIDGDLCADLCIGMPLRRHDTDSSAAVEARSGRTGAVLWRCTNEEASFGAALAALGDVDGDAVPDLVVGRSPRRLADDIRGAAVVVSGRTGVPVRELTADRGSVWFGASVANAGDVTGDGIDDVVVGGNFGQTCGLVGVFDTRSGALVASFADQSPDRDFGSLVAGAGDLDGDGHAEIIVTAPAAASSGPGRVLVLSCRTGKPLYELRGERPRESFGSAILRLADWRGDRQPSLAVAARAGGPVGNGYVRVFDLRTGNPLQTFASGQQHARFAYALCDLGDRDHDGLPDLGVMSLHRRGFAELWAMSFVDAFPASPRRR